jgi:opacity protein-like surface antigen
MRRIAFLLAAATVLALTAAPAAVAQAADKDCADFSSQAEAQQYFEANGGSPTNNVDNLDADHDGRACESFDYGSDGGTAPGGGGGNDDSLPFTGLSHTQLPLGAGLVAAGLLLVGVTARRYQGRHARR